MTILIKPKSNMKDATVQVDQVEMDLEDVLGTPGAENVLIPETEKPSIFSRPGNNKLSALNIDKEEEEEEKKEDQEEKKDEVKAELKELLEDDIKDEEEEELEDNTKSAAGRKKLDKSGLTSVVNKLIEKGQLFAFDDEKPVDEYSEKDFEELLEANFQEREKKIRDEAPEQFFEALPTELQYAAAYVAKGGTDLKGLFKVLSQVEETKALDPTKPEDSEQIVRKYLSTITWGTEEEIEDEINRIKDKEELLVKATQFKPKLDAKEQEQVAKRLADRDAHNAKQQKAAQAYMSNVFETLKVGELAGIKLDKKTQAQLYTGLIEPSYPSMSGRKTNLLGHLLEKHQYVEPNYALIAEALWLLSNPEEYRAKIAEKGKTQSTNETVRKLKVAEQEKENANTEIEKNETKVRKIPRSNTSFFKRPGT